MSFKEMVIKCWHILEGNFKHLFKIYPKYAMNRLDICNKCSNKDYMPLVGYYCKICGCIIKSKICVKEEKCPHNKW